MIKLYYFTSSWGTSVVTAGSLKEAQDLVDTELDMEEWHLEEVKTLNELGSPAIIHYYVE